MLRRADNEHIRTDFNAAFDAIDIAIGLAAGVYANAGSHNSVYRGQCIGSSVTTEQYAAMAAGTFEDMFIGDYWTISGINYRIAGFDYYYNTGDTVMDDHHVVIVPDTCFYDNSMNDTSTTSGAYQGSKMYLSRLDSAKTIVNTNFSGHVITKRLYLANAVSGDQASSADFYNSTVDLMSETMVYGTRVNIGNLKGLYDVGVEKSQLPLFQYRHDLIGIRDDYWLRDVYSSTQFTRVGLYGRAHYSSASVVIGVRPSFCIG